MGERVALSKIVDEEELDIREVSYRWGLGDSSTREARHHTVSFTNDRYVDLLATVGVADLGTSSMKENFRPMWCVTQRDEILLYMKSCVKQDIHKFRGCSGSIEEERSRAFLS